MADYKCSKCGETAHSKCIYSRSIFGENQTAALLTHVLKRTVEPFEDQHSNKPEFKYVFTYTTVAENEFKALKSLVNLLSLPGVMESYACDHDYVLQDEECDLGCCHKKKGVA